MSTNHQLKSCLFDFLSDRTFSGYEFKDLRGLFILFYPEFSSKRYYSKIYQYVRELVSLKLILADTSSCTYKYSSNYTRSELLDFRESNDSDHVKSKLLVEYDRVLKSIDSLRNELHIYELYLEKFPVLSESIMKFISKKQKEINFLECEIQAIKTLLEAC
ncbi:hypothetical protein XA39_02620 [Acinetobacter tandoii]|uniref:hypothetical protein n=1 Tax=Acinetobacter TaxID=469 RepID=UPI000C2085C3|nr:MULTISPECIES: hypothetical protein [Acinetobacter]PJG44239.1 hypothetical protein XA39_02620 [Acinetobacter tandoii]